MRERVQAPAPAAQAPAPREQHAHSALAEAPSPRIGHEFSRVSVLQRAVSYDECTPNQEQQIGETHARAREMVKNAFTQLTKRTLDPTVRRSLELRFNSANFIVRVLVADAFLDLRKQSRSPQYECQSTQIGGRLGYTLWCVPFSDIELYPDWFSHPDIDIRAKTLIHEWCHRYMCIFDFSVLTRDPEDIREGTLLALHNADSYAYFAYDIRNVT